MKFRCRETHKARRKRLVNWHLWFAWRPVWVEHTPEKGCWHWLEYVARKGTRQLTWDDCYWDWEYMLMEDE